MRLIDADALKGAFLEELFVKSGKSVQDIIDEAPTIEQSAEPSGDVISRADAKRKVYLLGKNPSINEIWDCLDALPSADRPKGEWIDREDSADAFFLYKYECSLCGGKNVFNSSYCPNCGAHMR